MVDDVVFNGRAKLALVSTCLIMRLFVLLAAAAAVCAVVSGLTVRRGKSTGSATLMQIFALSNFATQE